MYKHILCLLVGISLALGTCYRVSAADIYVSTNGTGAGTSWADATNSLQGALGIAVSGDTVWANSGQTYGGALTVGDGVTLRSRYNDPTNTILASQWSGRTVTLGVGSWVRGFRISGGMAETGGGVQGGSVSNCIITLNQATARGGGAYQSTIYNSIVSANTAYLSGSDPFIGRGGGVDTCSVWNSLISGNQSAGNEGGGAYASALYNCTLFGNIGSGVVGQPSAQSLACYFYNSISVGGNQYISHDEYSCGDGFTGVGSITSDPLLNADGTLQLASPCIDAGNNEAWAGLSNTVDLAGNPRIMDGTVDMGAYEAFGLPMVSLVYNWSIGGRITGDTPQWMLPGSAGTEVAATPHVGCTFSNWSDGVLTHNRTDTAATNGMTVTAVFELALTLDSGGAGAYGAVIYDSIIVSNHITAAGTAGGGGAASCVLYRCKILDNSSSFAGGGIIDSTAINCILHNNSTE